MRNQKNIMLFSGIILFAALMGLVRTQKTHESEKQVATKMIIKDHYTIRTTPVIKDTPSLNIPLLGQVVAITTNDEEEAVLQLELQVREKYSPLVELKQTVNIEPESLTGTVVKITAANPTDIYAATIEVSAIDPEKQFSIGTFVRATIPLKDGDPVLLIPTSSVLIKNQQACVYIETEPGSYERRWVQLDQNFGDWTSLKTGVQPGDNVVNNGLFLIDAESEDR